MSAGDVQVRLRDLRERLTDDVKRALLQRAAVHAIGIIKRRTTSGVDVDGQAFAPYSKEYSRLKSATGRSSNVDLTLTGNMLASMVVLDVDAERALIGFQGASSPVQFKRLRTKSGKATSKKSGPDLSGKHRRITHTLSRPTRSSSRSGAQRPVANAVKAKAANEGLGHQPRRHFFALSPEEKREVIAEAARTLKLKR